MTSLPPVTQAFSKASELYTAASKALVPPNRMRDSVPSAENITKAAGDAAQAAKLLEPYATGTDQFTSRNVHSSLAAAKEGLDALAPVISYYNKLAQGFEPFMEPSTIAERTGFANSRFNIAEQTLWYE